MTQSEQILQHITDLIRRHAGTPLCTKYVVVLIQGYADALKAEKEKANAK